MPDIALGQRGVTNSDMRMAGNAEFSLCLYKQRPLVEPLRSEAVLKIYMTCRSYQSLMNNR